MWLWDISDIINTWLVIPKGYNCESMSKFEVLRYIAY